MKKYIISLIILLAFCLLFSCKRDPKSENGDFAYEFDSKTKSATLLYYGGTDTDVVIPEKVGEYTVNKIGRQAFSHQYEIKNIKLPDTLNTIEEKAFEYCIGLEEIILPSSLKTIGNTAFSSCRGLKKIYIPKCVEKIGLCAFNGCTSLEEISVDDNNKYYSSDKYGVLLDKEQTKIIQFPIGSERASYVMPDTVTTVESYAFEKTSNLKSITFSQNISTLKSYAFQKSGIKSALFNDKLEIIGAFCFNEAMINKIDLGNSVKQIGDSAFSWCTSLVEIAIPSSTETIGSSAFYMCTNLNRFTVDSQNQNYSSDGFGAMFNKDKTTILFYPQASTEKEYSIPDTVTTISAHAFFSNINLEKVTIPSSVKKIEQQAFANCLSLIDVVYKGEKPQDIAANAFEKSES